MLSVKKTLLAAALAALVIITALLFLIRIESSRANEAHPRIGEQTGGPDLI